MGALTVNNHNTHKRDFDSQYDFNTHLSKRRKPSPYFVPKPVTSLGSRLSQYPKAVTPFSKQVQAPCLVLKGFVPKKLDTRLLDSPRMGNLFSHFTAKPKEKENRDDSLAGKQADYKRARKAAIDSLRFVPFDDDDDDDEVVEVVDVENVDNVENVANDDGSGGSGRSSGGSEVVMMETDDKSVEVHTIRAKYRELDERPKGMEIVLDGESLESLSLSDDGTPYHKKLWDDSAKRDSTLRRQGFDIKLLEAKRASLKESAPQKKPEVKPKELLVEPFRKLTEDDEELVTRAFSNASRRKALVTHENSNITITGEVLRCLLPGAWLNDEVINLYLELLKERESKEPKKFLKCHFFNTFFYKKLIGGKGGYDYKSVRRWTSQRKLGYSLLECDKIFVPVHKEIHWCLAVINIKEKKFQYLDSLGGGDRQVMGVLEQYIVDEVKDKNGKDIDVTSWKQEFVTDLPNQQNGFDCGVFMIKYTDFYSRDIGLCFEQKHMPYFRRRTAKEILKLRAD